MNLIQCNIFTPTAKKASKVRFDINVIYFTHQEFGLGI